MNEALQQSLYSSPYPTITSYVLHVVFGALYICILSAWSFTKEICCSKEGLSEYSVCYICCPAFAPSDKQLKDNDNVDDNLGLDEIHNRLAGLEKPNANVGANADANANNINSNGNTTADQQEKSKQEESSESGGVAYTKTNVHSDLETVCSDFVFYLKKKKPKKKITTKQKKFQ
ncbi:hypothetical protein RFI_26978 [Reticulomyxa filosa]|uniref:Uncharacterized protein n=1 Tax=Reticulomyxa filosa TaxID=46433 RepID=X6M956_RETFI|nr:hypothetical protein RFI_26978 [Reticulomyxa filosa]|eukprot:ETO10399.1 hypothetical protein RFI_26978 [Reticulomyxa filosa]